MFIISYFENLAVQTLDHLYEANRHEAYTSLTAHLPFRLSHNVTPLSLADDAVCMRVTGHPCAQTLLILIWMNHLNIDTHPFKLLPIFTLLPFLNLPFITVDPDSLSFGAHQQWSESLDEAETEKQDETATFPARTESLAVPPGT